jgi:hypothetical protein
VNHCPSSGTKPLLRKGNYPKSRLGASIGAARGTGIEQRETGVLKRSVDKQGKSTSRQRNINSSTTSGGEVLSGSEINRNYASRCDRNLTNTSSREIGDKILGTQVVNLEQQQQRDEETKSQLPKPKKR